MRSDRKRRRVADMILQEKLSALKKDFEAKAAKDVVEIMHRATEDLKDWLLPSKCTTFHH